MFNNKVVLLTCASSKIGEVIAVQFAKLGANLALFSKKENNLEKVALQCEKVGKNKPLTITGELTNESDIQNILESTVQHFRKLDVLINNAAVLETGSIEDTTLEQFDRVFNTNVRSVYHLTMLAVPHLIKTKGNIVNVSVNGNKPCAGVLAYKMSKSGLDQFTCSAALELASKLVRVNSVSPMFLVSGIDKYDTLVKELYDNYDFVKGSYNTFYFILNFVMWSETTDAVDMHFYCPHGDTRDGSVFVIAKFKNGPTFVTFHCCEIHCDYIIKYLNETNVINWRENLTFEGIHEKLVPILKTVIAEKKLKIVKDDVCHQVWLNQSKRKKLLVLAPDPLYLAPMKPEEFKYVKKYWEYYSPETDVIVNATLTNNCALGLYHRENDSIVGWAVEQHFGGIGMLHVLEECRNQGYGSILTQGMCHRMMDRQIDPYAFIHVSNNRSIALFKKVGFKQICLVHWISTTKL